MLFAVSTVVFHDRITAFQVARGAGEEAEVSAFQVARGAGEEAEVSASIWIRAGLVVVPALLYLWMARRLRQGSRRAYLRVRVLAAVGAVAVGYLIASGQYPVWLRVVQAAQFAALLALLFLVTRPEVRALFPKRPRPPGGDRRAALVLVVLAPVVAEVTLGSTPVSRIWLLLLWLPIYGAGVLLIRELARRSGTGWAGILVLGLAYGIVEEGIALQALSSPTLYGAGDWAPRLLGLNSAYTEVMLPYHAVFSVAIPILLTELMFPASRSAPYLRRGGLIATAVTAVLGVGLLRLAVPPSEDPGYTIPAPVLIGCVLAVAALGLLALAVLPRRAPRPPSPGRAPGPWWLAAFGLVSVLGFLVLLYPFAGAGRSAFTHGDWTYLPMAAAALLAVVAALLIGRWSRTRDWNDRHSLALAAGALVAHTAFGAVTIPDTTLDLLGLIALGAAMVAGLVSLARTITRRKHMFGRGKNKNEAWTGVVAEKKRSSPDGQNMYHHVLVRTDDGQVKDVRVKGRLWRTLEVGDRLRKVAGETQPGKA
ncbi:hypothetical protein Pen01_30040 [Phytomonospora endophytica]|nr:hypothetical protein Pen01_30040 [Phytomonospora endophytica]